MSSSDPKRFDRKIFDKYTPSADSPSKETEELIEDEFIFIEDSDQDLVEDNGAAGTPTNNRTQNRQTSADKISNDNKERKNTRKSTQDSNDNEKPSSHNNSQKTSTSGLRSETSSKKSSQKAAKTGKDSETKTSNSFGADEDTSTQKRSLSKAEQGKATPSRKEQEEARKKPLVQSQAQTREEKRDQRVKDKEARDKERQLQQEALKSGDPRADKYLPERDQGPQKRYARDLIDGMKFDVGQYVIGIVLLLIIPSFLPLGESVKAIIMIVFYVFLFVVVVSRIFIARKVSTAVKEKFGHVDKGVVMYAVMRSIQFRRWRLPKPNVKPGEEPTDVKSKK